MAVTSKLARYRDISTLGSGGMATVVLAEDTMLGRPVALKRMIAVADPRGLSRLRREALLGASVSHRNLVSIYDVVTTEDGDLVIVMEYVPGETLQEAIKRQGRLPASEALRILEGVAAGLDTIHQQGIVHRDVKPPNILLGADGAVKVADLGIASVPDRTRITTAGGVLGSLSYMAPEQLEDAPSTPAIDIYALAAVTFEVLSGRKARLETNPLALAHAISTQPSPDLRDAWPEAPRPTAELLIRAMSRDPDARPHSAGELISLLRAALEPENTAPVVMTAPAPAPPAPPAPPAQRQVSRTPPPPRRRAVPPAARRQAAGAGAAVSANRRARAAGRPARREPARRWPVAVLLGLVGLAVLLAVLLNSGGAQSPKGSAAAAGHRSHAGKAAAHKSATGAAAASGSSTAAGSAAATTSAAAPATGSPVSAVETFYGLAAAHRYPDAWAIADPTFRNQLGGYQSFEAGQQGDRSIHFNSARVVNQSSNGATVAVTTTSVRTDGTHHCSGTVDLLRSGSSGSWLLHTIHINCT